METTVTEWILRIIIMTIGSLAIISITAEIILWVKDKIELNRYRKSR